MQRGGPGAATHVWQEIERGAQCLDIRRPKVMWRDGRLQGCRLTVG